MQVVDIQMNSPGNLMLTTGLRSVKDVDLLSPKRNGTQEGSNAQYWTTKAQQYLNEMQSTGDRASGAGLPPKSVKHHRNH